MGIDSHNARMLTRLYATLVNDKLRKYPAVAILGPRQCGKTTLAKQMGGRYFDMESPGSQTRLDAEWDQLAAGTERVIIDEAQQAPAVFSRLRGTIDADRQRKGRFLLLGSVSPALMENISESLAGRLGLVRMSPLILPEVGEPRMDDLWLFGGYPDGGILQAEMFPQWQQDYLETLATRDLPAWGLPAKPQLTLRLLAMLAAVHGQPLNASQLGASLALNHKTVLTYCDFLEGAYLIRRLPPFFSNLSKRLVKSPRVYWRDSGLMHGLMNVADMEQLYAQPWLGHSWEGFVIEQTLAALTATGQHVQPFFFRTSDGHELDLVLDWGTRRWAIEIKLTSDPSPQMLTRLDQTARMIDADKQILICRIAKPFQNERLVVTNLASWMDELTP